MIIETLAVGPIMANCYILGCEETGLAAVIDPGDEATRILEAVARRKLNVTAILNTHGHFDHVGANAPLKAATGADIMIHALDTPMLADLASAGRMFGLRVENSPPPDRTLGDGDRIQVGNLTLEVIHTPGHTPGGVAFHTDGVVFVGDTLFAGSIGRTDLPGGNFDTLIHSIHTRLFTLDDAVQVYPGHMGTTTIGREKRYNPFAGGG
jgi:hydroxyacylglutathione hydrolase